MLRADLFSKPSGGGRMRANRGSGPPPLFSGGWAAEGACPGRFGVSEWALGAAAGLAGAAFFHTVGLLGRWGYSAVAAAAGMKTVGLLVLAAAWFGFRRAEGTGLPTRDLLVRCWVMGVLQAAANICEAWTVVLGGAGYAAALVSAIPVLGVVFSAVGLRRRPGGVVLAGAAAGGLGVLLVGGGGVWGGAVPVGALLLGLAGPVFFALGDVVLVPLSQKLGAAASKLWTNTAAVPLLWAGVLLLPDGGTGGPGGASGVAAVAAAAVGGVVMTSGAVAAAELFARTGGGRGQVMSLLITVFAVSGSLLLGLETFNWYQAAGFTLIGLGGWGMSRPEPTARAT